MPHVIQHPDGSFLVKKDAWTVTFSHTLNEARVFKTDKAATNALNTMNDGYMKRVDPEGYDIREVDITLK